MKRLLAYLIVVISLGLTFSVNANAKTYFCVPKNISELEPKNLARERLAFDELFAHQISLALARKQYRKTKGISIKSSGLFANQIRRALPFSLTEAQDKAICHIKKDLMSDLRTVSYTHLRAHET